MWNLTGSLQTECPKWVLSKYGDYTSYLATLTENSPVKPDDHAKFTMYLGKWMDAKYLLGCALFTDLLLTCATLSKSMHADQLDVLGSLSNLLRTLKETKKLSTRPLEQWPTYATTMKITDKNEEKVYQGQVLKKFIQAKSHLENCY